MLLSRGMKMLDSQVNSHLEPKSIWRSIRDSFRSYLALTKPRIILLLLITATSSMFLAARGFPGFTLWGLVILGGSLGAGGANALNHYLDRDLDERMERTRRRPIPSLRVKPFTALIFGITLNIVAFAILALWVNLLSAFLTLSATLFYVFVYTLWLKRSTPQNIVIGGAAGAVPPLVGWAAVTGGIDLPALYLFTIIFFWTPPHFWALALLLQGDYAQAGVPMLPVVRGVSHTTRSIVLYVLVLLAVTTLFYTTQAVGWIYLVGSSAAGALFLLLTLRLLRTSTLRHARQVYLYSLFYLAGLFSLIVLDTTLAV
jgi:protoheme IX farnesyltransferase